MHTAHLLTEGGSFSALHLPSQNPLHDTPFHNTPFMEPTFTEPPTDGTPLRMELPAQDGITC